ncbi:MAG TPA: hypothetical protein VKX29_04285 [Brumimicrobium sp.]|nr:hypothetical protein [Brumimicrobium sp.]
MKINKVTSLLISGTFLTFISLSDLDNFSIMLHGFFLVIGVLAILMAFIEFYKSKNKDAE